MNPLTLGDVSVTSVVERDGPWRAPEIMYPTCYKEIAIAHLKSMEPFIYDAAANKLVITYQT
jgi:hypothetical protein